MRLGDKQPEYEVLPVQAGGWPEYPVLFCFEPTAEEISVMIRTRKIWVEQLTFGKRFQPIWLGVERPAAEAAGDGRSKRGDVEACHACGTWMLPDENRCSKCGVAWRPFDGPETVVKPRMDANERESGKDDPLLTSNSQLPTSSPQATAPEVQS